MTETLRRAPLGASVFSMPVLQDGPPPGGFPSVRYGRRIPSTGPTGAAMFGVSALIIGYGFYKARREGSKLEGVCAAVCLKEEASLTSPHAGWQRQRQALRATGGEARRASGAGARAAGTSLWPLQACPPLPRFALLTRRPPRRLPRPRRTGGTLRRARRRWRRRRTSCATSPAGGLAPPPTTAAAGPRPHWGCGRARPTREGRVVHPSSVKQPSAALRRPDRYGVRHFGFRLCSFCCPPFVLLRPRPPARPPARRAQPLNNTAARALAGQRCCRGWPCPLPCPPPFACFACFARPVHPQMIFFFSRNRRM